MLIQLETGGSGGLVAKSCPTLVTPLDCNLSGSSVHGDSPGKNTGVGCHFLLQGISPTQESNPGLLHCRQILYRLSKIGASTKKERHFPTSVLFAQMHEGQSTQEVLELHMSGEATSSISATRSPLSR